MNVSCDLPCKLGVARRLVQYSSTCAAINNFDAASLPQWLLRRMYMLDSARRDSISITTIERRGARAMRRRTQGTVLRRDRHVAES
jgi:hypothetical protein